MYICLLVIISHIFVLSHIRSYLYIELYDTTGIVSNPTNIPYNNIIWQCTHINAVRWNRQLFFPLPSKHHERTLPFGWCWCLNASIKAHIDTHYIQLAHKWASVGWRAKVTADPSVQRHTRYVHRTFVSIHVVATQNPCHIHIYIGYDAAAPVFRPTDSTRQTENHLSHLLVVFLILTLALADPSGAHTFLHTAHQNQTVHARRLSPISVCIEICLLRHHFALTLCLLKLNEVKTVLSNCRTHFCVVGPVIPPSQLHLSIYEYIHS